jgi:hypothetical protein
MEAYARGEFGTPLVDLAKVDRVIAIGSDRMMKAVRDARKGSMRACLPKAEVAVGSINSPMQCMLKEVCAQCLQRQVDPATGKASYVFTCFNQDQDLDAVDFDHLAGRLRQSSMQEKLSGLFLDRLWRLGPPARQV